MTEDLIRSIVPTLNKEDFVRFISELWKLSNISNGVSYSKTSRQKKLGNDVFEEHYWAKNTYNGLFSHQGYNLIVPFFQPMDLFESFNSSELLDKELEIILYKYKKILNKRIQNWQYWTDGNYCCPIIQFVSNYEGLDTDFYSNILLPLFENLLEKYQIEAEAAFGSVDSFFDVNIDKTIIAFDNFISDYKKNISISLGGENVSVDYFTSEKYITDGVLNRNRYPLEPIFIEKYIEKNEIIKEFEFLIQTNAKERYLSLFLQMHYIDIFGDKYNSLKAEVWLNFPEMDISNKNRRLDLFLRNAIEDDWELFEIKRPKQIVSTYRGDIPTFTKELYQSIQQLRAYEHILCQNTVKNKLAEDGIKYFFPKLCLVAGVRPSISQTQWRWLKHSNENNLKIITYDELLDSMKLRYGLQLKGIYELIHNKTN